MTESLPVSNELLNAFVDNELEGDERDWILYLEANDPQVAREICELRKLKSRVRAARVEISREQVNTRLYKNPHSLVWYAVASVMIVVSLLLVAMPQKVAMQYQYASKSSHSDYASLLQSVSQQPQQNLVLHIRTDQPEAMQHVARLAEALLQTAGDKKHQLVIEVIASGPGLRLLQSGSKGFAGRLRAIQTAYPNVKFIACRKTLKKLNQKNPGKLQIMKEAMLVASGPDHARLRVEQGWTYILL